ncbi:hypothetical protein IE53DRAFT_339721 [Violaceomyces palustris]|uniref:Uncharacterized protein n=1 Tax=Violaceomyces palustris TaxID=1673888 RepID=A0ACD0P4N7_9BASI|nr:hypothetical protein IE53DRAFT_339721 [Violaceomyces palustris]
MPTRTALSANPTRILPNLKTQPCSEQLVYCLIHLSQLYSPSSKSKSCAYLPDDPFGPGASQGVEEVERWQNLLDEARVDQTEKRFSMNWLTRLISTGAFWLEEGEDDQLSPEDILDFAGRILGGQASLEESGSLVRDFTFPLGEKCHHGFTENLSSEAEASSKLNWAGNVEKVVRISLRDAPLPPSEEEKSQESADAVGVQTWGSAVVMSDLMVRRPEEFHPRLSGHAPEMDANGKRYTSSQTGKFRVAELGAGTGLVGMVAAKILENLSTSEQGREGKEGPDPVVETMYEVVLTDYHEQVLENLEYNREQNFGDTRSKAVNIQASKLDWKSHLSSQTRDGGSEGELVSFPLILAADVIYTKEHATWLKSCIHTLLSTPDVDPNASAHILIPLRTSGKFESIDKTVDQAFGPLWNSSRLPSLVNTATPTPMDTAPGTPYLTAREQAKVLGMGQRRGTYSQNFQEEVKVTRPGQVRTNYMLVLKEKVKLGKIKGIGRQDESGYFWYKVGWVQE